MAPFTFTLDFNTLQLQLRHSLFFSKPKLCRVYHPRPSTNIITFSFIQRTQTATKYSSSLEIVTKRAPPASFEPKAGISSTSSSSEVSERVKKKKKKKKNKDKDCPEVKLKNALDMCSKRGDVMGALSLYDSAISEGVKLGQHHYTVLSSLLFHIYFSFDCVCKIVALLTIQLNFFFVLIIIVGFDLYSIYIDF